MLCLNSYQKAFILFAESLSPEVQQSMDAAMEAMAKSKAIRKEVIEVIDHTQRMQAAAHSAVNEGLVRKLAQTVTLTVSTPLVRIIFYLKDSSTVIFAQLYIPTPPHYILYSVTLLYTCIHLQ